MRLPIHLDPAPPERDDIDKCLVDVCVLGDEVQGEVQGEYGRIEDVRGGFGEDVNCVFHCNVLALTCMIDPHSE